MADTTPAPAGPELDMAETSEWSDLPSVVLLELYKYLPLSDRLKASSASANWRVPVFQLSPYKRLDLRLANFESDAPKVRFLASHFVHKVPEVNLTFNAASPAALELVHEILTKLQANTALRTLVLHPTHDALSKELFYGQTTAALILRQYFIRKVLDPLCAVLQSRNSLQTLSFPLIEEMSGARETLQSTLFRTPRLHALRHLFIPTLPTPSRFRPTNALLRNPPQPLLPVAFTQAFVHLQMLSLDQAVLSDEALKRLGVGSQSGGLKRLTLIAFKANAGLSNVGWSEFAANNPACDIRLTLVGSACIFSNGAQIIFPAMRITHFRAFYCQELRISALNSLILWNLTSLAHLELVNEQLDWMEAIIAENLNEQVHFVDPIIYAAWRCPNLAFIRIGFRYCGENLVGIARLKESRLLKLEIPATLIEYHNLDQLSQEVSTALTRPWTPLEDDEARRPSRSQALCRKVTSASIALLQDEG